MCDLSSDEILRSSGPTIYDAHPPPLLLTFLSSIATVHDLISNSEKRLYRLQLNKLAANTTSCRRAKQKDKSQQFATRRRQTKL